MTNEEFIIACGGPLAAAYGPIDVTTLRMYRSFLEDFTPDVLGAAVAKCIAESKWLPKISEIRLAAVEVVRGTFHEMSATEAWGVAWKASARISFDANGGNLERIRPTVPPVIWQAMEAVGLRLLVNADTHQIVAVKKAFDEAYNAMLQRERKTLIAPPQVRRAIEAHAANARILPPSEAARNVAGLIGAAE